MAEEVIQHTRDKPSNRNNYSGTNCPISMEKRGDVNTTNFSQNVREPSKAISYPVGDLCRCFTKLTGPCAYTLHSNLIPPTGSTNGLW